MVDRGAGSTDYDVVIVGARCAGAPTALLLARAGHRVLVVDRATFPSDTISTHFIQLSGIARLERWGLLEEVQATGCPVIKTGCLDFGAEPLQADTTMGSSLPGNFAPRRTVLDKILVDAARAAGAEVKEGACVAGVIVEDGRAVAIEARDQDGTSFTATAPLIVGADGRNSLVARAVDAPTTQEVPSLSWGYYSYWSDVECDGAELYLHENRFTVAFPTNDGLTLVGVGFPMEEFDDVRKDAEERFLSTLDEMGTLGARIREGRRAERIVGLRENPNFLRQPHGPGWALVGDAGYHKDPTPAHGISDAFRDAELLAGAVDDWLSGRATREEALARRHEERDEKAKPELDATVTMSSFSTPPVERAHAFLELGMMQLDEIGPPIAAGAS